MSNGPVRGGCIAFGALLILLVQISVLSYSANSADLVQTPLNAASDQGQHCLLTEIPIENAVK